MVNISWVTVSLTLVKESIKGALHSALKLIKKLWGRVYKSKVPLVKNVGSILGLPRSKGEGSSQKT